MPRTTRHRDVRIALLGPVSLDLLRDLAEIDGLEERHTAPLIAHLAREYLRLGHDVTIITLREGLDEPRLSLGKLSVRVGPMRSRGRARDFFRDEISTVRTMLVAEDFDVVHAHWTYEFALAALQQNVPTLVTVHDWAPTVLRYQPDPYRAVRLMMQAKALVKATKLSAVSPYLARRVESVYRKSVEVIPNPVVLDSASVRRSDYDAPPTLLAVNNGFGSRKNVPALLRALPRIRSRIPGATLRLMGLGYEPNGDADRWARSEGLSDGVHFDGPMPFAGVAQRMRCASAFVHPALEETFGMVIAEAMAAGTPVVAGRSSGAVPWVAGAAGVLVDVSDPEAIADAVVSLLSDQHLWVTHSELGQARCQELFSVGSVAKAYLRTYDRVRSQA